MGQRSRSVAVFLAAAISAYASGPVDFGMSELNAAIAAGNFKYKPHIVTEINLEAPETFRIEPYAAGGGRIAGGDLRGLMYGLLEAAEQMRATGRLKQTHGMPPLTPRGVKLSADPMAAWFGSESFWSGFMPWLARDRFDRLQIVFERFPARDQFPILRMISQTSSQYGVDVALGIKSATDDFSPLLQDLLTQCAAIRSVSLAGGAEEMKTPVLQVLSKAGRRVLLDDNRLWQINPLQNGSDEGSIKALLTTLTSGFEVTVPESADGKPDRRLIGPWGRLGYQR